MPNDDLIGSSDAAALCEVDRATFNRWVAAGRIEPAVTMPGLRGARLFHRDAVLDLIAEAAS